MTIPGQIICRSLIPAVLALLIFQGAGPAAAAPVLSDEIGPTSFTKYIPANRQEPTSDDRHRKPRMDQSIRGSDVTQRWT